MKTTIDYTNSPTKAFDAVEDIKEYLGDRYRTCADYMKTVTDVDTFMALCGIAGIEGYPVRAWYDHFHGEGSFKKNFRL